MATVRVLQIIVGGKNFNGVASFLYQYYQHMNHEKVHFDFFVVRENALEARKEDPVFQDSKFYVLNAVKKNNKTDHIKMMRGLDKLLSEEHFDIVHINTMSVGAHVPLIHVCRKHHIQTIISHSHNEYSNNMRFSKLLAHKLFMSYINKNADGLFACSLKAGKCLFGEKGVRMGKFRVINNAIDPDQFGFSPAKRKMMREQFNVSDSMIIIGQIGRLSRQKNQGFGIDVFHDFHNKMPDSQFWIVGQGEDQEKLETQVEKNGLSDSVIFMGQRNDVNDLLTAMDILLFPSRWEGLSVAAIEAQSTGIPILASDKITPETAVTDLVQFLPLDAGASAWADQLSELAGQNRDRHGRREDIERSGFSIADAAKQLQEYYCSRREKAN